MCKTMNTFSGSLARSSDHMKKISLIECESVKSVIKIREWIDKCLKSDAKRTMQYNTVNL